jgi:phosphoglycolate phosphatase
LKIEGVVFDLDATLVDLGGFVNWKEAHKHVIERYNDCGCSEITKTCDGKGLFDTLNILQDQLCNINSSYDAERVQDSVYAIIEKYESEGVNQCVLLPGCREALDWLRAEGIKIGLATSNSQHVAEDVLELNGIRTYFTAVVGRSSKLRMKPHPDQIISCFNKLGVDPKKGLVVGDSVRDVEAAKAAGAYAIAIPARFTNMKALEESGPNKIIKSLKELPNVISSL